MAITVNGGQPTANLTLSSELSAAITDESGTGSLVFNTSPSLTTPALGTPSALVLTNATGLPVSGITASTSTALGVGSVELGHATDTTIARASAGVVTIEGVNVVTTSSTDTLTNKTLTTPVISSISNTGTLTLPTSTDTLVGRDTTDTLTNKTLTSPTVGTSISLADRGEVRFVEATANGTNYVGFEAPASVASNLIWVLPSADGAASSVLTTDGSGTLSFAAASAGVSANDQAFAFAVQVFA